MTGLESVFEMVHISRPKSPRKIIFHEFWRKEFAYLQTNLFMEAIATVNKQLLSSNDVE